MAQAVPLEQLEHLQDSLRAGGPTFPFLGIEREHVDLLESHRQGDFSFQKGLHREGEEVAKEQTFEPSSRGSIAVERPRRAAQCRSRESNRHVRFLPERSPVRRLAGLAHGGGAHQGKRE